MNQGPEYQAKALYERAGMLAINASQGDNPDLDRDVAVLGRDVVAPEFEAYMSALFASGLRHSGGVHRRGGPGESEADPVLMLRDAFRSAEDCYAFGRRYDDSRTDGKRTENLLRLATALLTLDNTGNYLDAIVIGE